MITRTIRGLLLVILGFPLTTYRGWRLARRGYSKYIKIPTPEEIAQAQAAALDPRNPASFAALAAKSNARAKEAKAKATDVGEWEHHIQEVGIHPLADDQTCNCKARHIPETSPPPQNPEQNQRNPGWSWGILLLTFTKLLLQVGYAKVWRLFGKRPWTYEIRDWSKRHLGWTMLILGFLIVTLLPGQILLPRIIGWNALPFVVFVNFLFVLGGHLFWDTRGKYIPIQRR